MKTKKSFFKKIILWYLKTAAKIQVRKLKPVIVGIGGSSGKSSLTNFVYLILKEKYSTRDTRGMNSESGLPLAILRLKMKNFKTADWFKAMVRAKLKVLFDWKKFDLFIAEMGVDGPFEPNNMSYLLKIVKPQIGVLTNINLEHSANFDSLVDKKDDKREEKILNLTAEQEMMLLTSIDQAGTAIVNLDDDKISENQNQIKARKITVSAKDKNASFYISKVQITLEEFKVYFYFTNEQYVITIKNPLPDYYAYSLVLAIAVGFAAGVSVEKSIDILQKNFSLPAGRFSIFEGIRNTTIIDSSYNSSFEPLKGALELVNRIASERRRLAILGDMRELGEVSESIHKKAGSEVVKNSDFAILIGPNMSEFAAPVLESKNFPFKAFKNFKSAREFILETIKSKDIILVKGSQNTLFLERAVEMLLKNPNDKDKLCRRGSFWDKKRSES